MSPTLSQERLLDHDYDGIQEYDNPLPCWLDVLFWATIVFAVLYLLYSPLGHGKGRIAHYEREMADARASSSEGPAQARSESTTRTIADMQDQDPTVMAGARSCSPRAARPATAPTAAATSAPT